MQTTEAASRPLLSPTQIDPKAQQQIAARHPEVLAEVQGAIQASKVVVVGMAQNPHVKKVRRALDEAKIEFQYLEYGSYFSKWRERLAIKLWSGWPTFPQVFVRGTLIGGEELTVKALADGTLQARLA